MSTIDYKEIDLTRIQTEARKLRVYPGLVQAPERLSTLPPCDATG